MNEEDSIKAFQFTFTDERETKEKVVEVYARDIKEARLLLDAWLKTKVMYKHDKGKYNAKRTKELKQDKKLNKRLTLKGLKEEYKLVNLKFNK